MIIIFIQLKNKNIYDFTKIIHHLYIIHPITSLTRTIHSDAIQMIDML
jgi:hypothetical protein